MKMKQKGEVELSVDKQTVASISEYRGEARLDIRHYWDGMPSKKGVNFPIVDALTVLGEIVELINECTDENLVIVSSDELE